MAVEKQQTCRIKASSKKTAPATKKSACKRKAPTEENASAGGTEDNNEQPTPIPADLPEPKPGEAADSLIGAIGKHVVLSCDEIAKAIVKKAKNGDVSGLRILAELTGARAAKSQSTKKTRRQVLDWNMEPLVAQPSWKLPSDPEVDTGFGGREPEN